MIDPDEAANQPLHVREGDLTIVYNGELFNYVELRRQLEGLGHRFRTRSDTEVVLRAYAEWGDLAVTSFNGMWAFAIYDRRRDVLFCSRDRFGIKPFNYSVAGQRFWFASEIKSLTAALPEVSRPDYTSLSMLLRTSRGARLEHTCFRDVRRLAPAHNLIVSRTGMEVRRYWDYPTATDARISLREASTEVRRLLQDSVTLRMRSDRPVGTALSAGLDSASIACLVGDLGAEPHRTFTAAYPDSSIDEASEAARLATRLGMLPHTVPTEAAGFLPTLRRIVRHLEAPGYSPAVVPLWNIMREARTHVTVLLDGQGADELFAGYTRDCAPYAMAEAARKGRLGRAWRHLVGQIRARGSVETLSFTGRAFAPGLHGVYRRIRGSEAVLAGPLLASDLEYPLESRNVLPISASLNDVLRNQHRGTLVDLLHYGDAMGMAHSIETRSPFLDHHLVELGFRLPAEYKYSGGVGKLVLREAMRGLVPERIVGSPRKLGFPVPIGEWFRRWKEVTVDPVLLSEACTDRGLFDPGALRHALERHRTGRADHANEIFRWLTTEIWFQEFID